VPSLRLTIFILLFGSVAGPAFSEGGCPDGQYPQQGQGWRTCIPIPNSGGPARSTAPAVWEDRWVALANDTGKAILGISRHADSLENARNGAIRDCLEKGGTNCKVDISSKNGCVAMVISTRLLTVGSGASTDDAERQALDRCREGSDRCEVYYSACSLAVRAR